MARIRVLKNKSPKEFILKKAAILFRKKGYSATSMRELAESIGIEAPSLYNHIGSKGDLLREICFSIGEEFSSNLDTVESTGNSSQAALEEIIRSHITIMINSPDEAYVANHEWKQLEEPSFTAYFHMRRAYESRMVKIIESGIRKGELKNLNPVVMMLTILAALRGIESWQKHRKNVSQLELEQTIVTHLLNGIIK